MLKMTVTPRAQEETTVERLNNLCALRGDFLSLDGERRQENRLQIWINAQKLILAVQDPNASFWELVRRLASPLDAQVLH